LRRKKHTWETMALVSMIVLPVLIYPSARADLAGLTWALLALLGAGMALAIAVS